MTDRDPARRLALEADETDPRHGTLTGYGAGCRCERCRGAYRDYWAAADRSALEGEPRRGPWTTLEVARLAAMYEAGATGPELVSAFGRSLGAIRKEAQRAGIVKRRPNARKGRRREKLSINRVNITGNLTRDPEVRRTSGGVAVVGFGVAVNDRRKNPQTGEWEDCPNFVDVTMFGKQGEAVSRYLSKGSKVAIEGKLRYSTWEKDGQRRSKLEVIADDVEFMSRREGAAPHGATPGAGAPPVYDEDVPF